MVLENGRSRWFSSEGFPLKQRKGTSCKEALARHVREVELAGRLAECPPVQWLADKKGAQFRAFAAQGRLVTLGCGSKPMGSHFGAGAPPILGCILVGIGMFTEGTGF